MIENLRENVFENNNTVCLFGAIDEEMTQRVLKQLLSLHFKFKEECTANPTVVVLINSPGGIVTGGLAILDTLKSLNCRIVTVCIGQAASMAATLLSCGTKGYRYALENSEIMIHQPLGGTQGQATDIEIHCAHMLQIKRKLNGILAENTGKTAKQISLDSERDFYMSAKEALGYGLVDKVLMNGFCEVYNEVPYK